MKPFVHLFPLVLVGAVAAHSACSDDGLSGGSGAGTYTTLGTLDQYGGGATNLVHSLTGLVVGGSAVNRKLRVKAASKNASSSAYYILIQSIQLLRTA